MELSDRIGKRWRERVDKVKEYEHVGDEVLEGSTPPFFSGVGYQEYQGAQELKQMLLKKHVGKTIEKIIPGNELKTKKGICYQIKNQNRINLKTINPDKAREKILSDLKLIHGIGEVTEKILKKGGYKTIEDLIEHPRFSSEALRFLEPLNKCDICRIADLIGSRFSRSHRLALYPSAFHEKEDFLILDIETLGLFGMPIILFGAAQIRGDDLVINQYFLRSIKEEPAALAGFLSHAGENCAFITFNGRTFDIPYIKERLAYYGMKGNLEKTHFDMLHFSRSAWKEQVPNCKLTTLEKHLLGIERKDDVPSALVPEFYEAYMRTGNAGPLIPIIEHNKQDLVTLANIFSKLHEEWE